MTIIEELSNYQNQFTHLYAAIAFTWLSSIFNITHNIIIIEKNVSLKHLSMGKI